MRKIKKIIIGLIFSLVFFLFVITTSVNFQLLNSSYLFSVFERHQIYNELPKILSDSLLNDPKLSAEEKLGLSMIFKNIPPAVVQSITQQNLTQVQSFIDGKSKDIVIFIPTKSLGLAPSDQTWSLSQNAPPQLKSQLQVLNGLKTKIIIFWILLLTALIILFFVYLKLASNGKISGGKYLLILNGSVLAGLGITAKVLLLAIEQGPKNAREPSQAILALLASSLFSEIVYLWIIIGLILILSSGIIIAAEKRSLI
ncbi:MAG: hypothetical protein HY426_00170 [Candidatus Levybacteria bacterium]|nr:hypothetical protein [Candidatus Levybacteria bacterium]